jgi:hypothetical protein
VAVNLTYQKGKSQTNSAVTRRQVRKEKVKKERKYGRKDITSKRIK